MACFCSYYTQHGIFQMTRQWENSWQTIRGKEQWICTCVLWLIYMIYQTLLTGIIHQVDIVSMECKPNGYGICAAGSAWITYLHIHHSRIGRITLQTGVTHRSSRRVVWLHTPGWTEEWCGCIHLDGQKGGDGDGEQYTTISVWVGPSATERPLLYSHPLSWIHYSVQ